MCLKIKSLYTYISKCLLICRPVTHAIIIDVQDCTKKQFYFEKQFMCMCACSIHRAQVGSPETKTDMRIGSSNRERTIEPALTHILRCAFVLARTTICRHYIFYFIFFFHYYTTIIGVYYYYFIIFRSDVQSSCDTFTNRT